VIRAAGAKRRERRRRQPAGGTQGQNVPAGAERRPVLRLGRRGAGAAVKERGSKAPAKAGRKCGGQGGAAVLSAAESGAKGGGFG